MNILLLILLVFILLSPVNGRAKSPNCIELGFNQSKFRNEKCISHPGLTFGIMKDFYPIHSFNGFIGFGINYQRKKFILEDRTWKSDPYFDDSDIEIGDINVNISYIELPVSVGYSIIIKNKTSSSIYTGFSLSIPIKNHTRISNQKTILLGPNERKTYPYDYIPLDENYTIPSTNIQIGFRLSYYQFVLIINYSRALSITEGVSSLSVRDKIDTFKMSAAFLF